MSELTNLIQKLKDPDIEKAGFNIDEYLKYVSNDMVKLLNMSFRRENIRWWDNQILNFKICVDKILRKMNYVNIQHTGKLSDPEWQRAQNYCMHRHAARPCCRLSDLSVTRYSGEILLLPIFIRGSS